MGDTSYLEWAALSNSYSGKLHLVNFGYPSMKKKELQQAEYPNGRMGDTSYLEWTAVAESRGAVVASWTW